LYWSLVDQTETNGLLVHELAETSEPGVVDCEVADDPAVELLYVVVRFPQPSQEPPSVGIEALRDHPDDQAADDRAHDPEHRRKSANQGIPF
jgi:hypothetical protein